MVKLHSVYMPPRDELMPELENLLYSGYIAEGPKVKEFEETFSNFIRIPSYAVSSCTAALHLALILSGVGPGDEVVSTPMTAEPTNVAIHMAGARVRWADVDPTTGNVTPQSVDEAVTENTKAILVVHYGGIPVQKIYDSTLPGVFVIEDCAHALGSEGIGWGDIQSWSFQAIKHFTTGGEGGMLSNRMVLDESQIRSLRWFGIDREKSRTTVDVKEHGWKYNMTDVQATFGLAAMRHLPQNIKRIKSNGWILEQALSRVPGLQVYQSGGHVPSYLFYTVLAERRDDLAKKLTEAGIGCGQVHRRNDEHTVFAYAKRELPGLDEYWKHMLHIPCGWWLGEQDLDYIERTIKSGW